MTTGVVYDYAGADKKCNGFCDLRRRMVTEVDAKGIETRVLRGACGVVPVEIRGVWSRVDLVINGEPVADETTVFWLQGPTAFVDLRVPLQNGVATSFAGETVVDGDNILFRHDIDLDPPFFDDSARLEWIDADTLKEVGEINFAGRVLLFEETWRRRSTAGSDLVTWRLRSKTGEVRGVSIKSGRYIGAACDGRDCGGVYRAILLEGDGAGWHRKQSIGCEAAQHSIDCRSIERILADEVGKGVGDWIEDRP